MQRRATPDTMPRRLLAAIAAALLVAACGSGSANSSPSQQASASTSTTPCIASGDETAINAALLGAGDEAVLCPNAIFELDTPVNITAPGQKVYTQGRPTDDTRATLILNNDISTSAVVMRDVDDAQLTNVIVDGNSTTLGFKQGDALIYAGGMSHGQVISDNVIRNTRSWSSLQIIEGGTVACRNATIERNVVGPAGTSKEWADGISFACLDSVVRGNTITDATDAAIAVFGAAGSIIEQNTVRAVTQTMLGGIGLIDYPPYDGNFEGTIVRNNIVESAGAVIRVAYGMGTRIWGCFDDSNAYPPIRGGSYIDNVLKGSKVQYGFVASGVTDWTVTDNRDESTHVGTPSNPCGSTVASKPGGFLYDPRYAKGTFQPEFKKAVLDLALWAIVKPKPGE